MDMLPADANYRAMVEGGRDLTAVVEAFNVAYNAHDIAGLRSVLLVNARFTYGQSPRSARDTVNDWEAYTFPEFPEIRFTASNRVARHDLVAQVERFEGATATGEVLAVYQIEDGCIVEVHHSNDRAIGGPQ